VFDGLASKLGGVLGLAFFVLVQPFGKHLTEFSRLPHEAILRGTWKRPAGAGI
jgi:hypothetical protein